MSASTKPLIYPLPVGLQPMLQAILDYGTASLQLSLGLIIQKVTLTDGDVVGA